MAQALCDSASFFLPHLMPLSFTLYPISQWSLFSSSNMYSPTAPGPLHMLPLCLECFTFSFSIFHLLPIPTSTPFSSLRSRGRTPPCPSPYTLPQTCFDSFMVPGTTLGHLDYCFTHFCFYLPQLNQNVPQNRYPSNFSCIPSTK